MSTRVIILLALALSQPVMALIRPSIIKSRRNSATSSTELQLFPQAVFAASCAGAVLAYVYMNIDSVREQQKIAVDKAMTEQASNIKNAQQKQQEAIAKAQREQEEAIRKIRESRK